MSFEPEPAKVTNDEGETAGADVAVTAATSQLRTGSVEVALFALTVIVLLVLAVA